MSPANKMWMIVTALAVVLALGGVGAAGWFGFSWWSAASRDTSKTVEARDGALKAARELAVTLQTEDPSKPEQVLQSWQAATTGPLLDQLQRDRDQRLGELKKNTTRSTATVPGIALTQLDAANGTATAIAALDVTQAAAQNGGATATTVQHLRLKLTLDRTDAGWKIANSDLVKA